MADQGTVTFPSLTPFPDLEYVYEILLFPIFDGSSVIRGTSAWVKCAYNAASIPRSNVLPMAATPGKKRAPITPFNPNPSPGIVFVNPGWKLLPTSFPICSSPSLLTLPKLPPRVQTVLFMNNRFKKEDITNYFAPLRSLQNVYVLVCSCHKAYCVAVF